MRLERLAVPRDILQSRKKADIGDIAQHDIFSPVKLFCGLTVRRKIHRLNQVAERMQFRLGLCVLVGSNTRQNLADTLHPTLTDDVVFAPALHPRSLFRQAQRVRLHWVI